ncbi:hypothetical protein CY35_05G118600 [Sphagnum magellanicum]|nr:hypothetical protein CY35_05G118600 [Sphagnum magellanicum]
MNCLGSGLHRCCPAKKIIMASGAVPLPRCLNSKQLTELLLHSIENCWFVGNLYLFLPIFQVSTSTLRTLLQLKIALWDHCLWPGSTIWGNSTSIACFVAVLLTNSP